MSGVRNSWDIVEMKSFFILSAVAISEAIEFIESHKIPISSSYFFSILAFKLPCAISFVVFVICLTGIIIDRIKKRFDNNIIANTKSTSTSIIAITVNIWESTSSIFVITLTAPTFAPAEF